MILCMVYYVNVLMKLLRWWTNNCSIPVHYIHHLAHYMFAARCRAEKMHQFTTFLHLVATIDWNECLTPTQPLFVSHLLSLRLQPQVWWNVNQRECLLQSEASLYWGLWGLWNREDLPYCKSCSSFHGPWSASKVEATSCLLLHTWKH